MAYELREQDFESFFEAPFNAYGDTSHYVSPLKSDMKRFLDFRKNPLFAEFGDGTYFSVLRDGIPVGRIVAHVHKASNELHDLDRCYFGFFDCVDDDVAACMLLQAAEDWGRAQDCREICGNFNLTAMQQIGVVTAGFENAPYMDQVYNEPHLVGLLERHGYERFFPMTTFEIASLKECCARVVHSRRRFGRKDGWNWLRLKLFGFRHLMAATRDVLNDGFRNNPMFVPLTEKEFRFQAGEMMWVIDQRISPLVFHHDEPVGVVVCVPDLNPLLRRVQSRFSWRFPFRYLQHLLNRKRAVIIFYAVKHSHHGQGLMTAMLGETVESLRDAGYESLGITWIADSNAASLRQMEKLGARELHETHLFRKPLKT